VTDQEKAEQWVAANRVRIELGADHHAVASLVVLIGKVREQEREASRRAMAQLQLVEKDRHDLAVEVAELKRGRNE
jgi:hypothetical protein